MKRHAPTIVVCVCVVAFVIGVIQLFQLRFEQGDVYPPYSSLRADPLGSMALYESLERTPSVTVRRDFSSRNQLPEGRDTTYLHLASDASEWRWVPESLVKEIEGFLMNGGRLVITCKPETSGNPFSFGGRSHDTNSPASKMRKDRKEKPPEESPKPRKPDENGNEDDETFVKSTDLRERWGFTVNYEKLPRADDDSAKPVTVRNSFNPALPESLAWHSSTLFTKLSTNWHVLYARGTNAVVIERRFGSGSVVFASDSFFVSNEALLNDRHAELLAWLVGPNRLVVFDEAHLGIVEQPGVTTLMRRYRLHGLIGGIALLMALFVWKNSFSLVPAIRREHAPNFVAGRDSAAGFVNLLRRSISVGEILKTCYEQWNKSVGGRTDLAASRVEQAKQTIQAELARGTLESNPVAAYQEVSRILKPGGPVAGENLPINQTSP